MKQQKLRQGMEIRFSRGTFPDTVAVVDPALQMRRKLTESAACCRPGPMPAIFLPMIDKAGAATERYACRQRAPSCLSKGGRLTLRTCHYLTTQ